MGVHCFDEQCQRIIRRIADSTHVSVVVGAGASIAAGLPGWEDLVKTLLMRGRGRRAKAVADLVVRTQGFLLATEAASMPSVKRRKKAVARALFGGESRNSFIPSKLHQAVAGLAKLRGPLNLEIFTTNYDDLLEQALRDEGLNCAPRYTPSNPHSRNRFAIHHVHGFLGADAESDDIVLGQSDYARIADGTRDWPGEEFGTAAARGPLLFVGASLTDPNLIRILSRIRDRRYERHVLVLARQGLEVPHELATPFLKQVKKQWAAYNVEVVLLDDYSDVSLFIREIGAAASKEYLGPRERVSTLWALVDGNFEALQEEFFAALEDGFREHLEPLLGREANLALWLADGWGQLVIFGANDRRYRSPKSLRRIPDRHDAGWVVSEALAFEAPLVKSIERSSGDERRFPEQRWTHIAAVPLRPQLLGQPMAVAGALSAAAVELDRPQFQKVGTVLENLLATEWERRLEDLLAIDERIARSQ